jgi:hypothetical protein
MYVKVTKKDIGPRNRRGLSCPAGREFKRPGRLIPTILGTLLIFLLAPAAVAFAQDKPPAASPASQDNLLSAHNKMTYGYVKTILISSAEKMPEENYSFKPTDAVRSYGQLLGHVADSQYMFCSIVLGEDNPARNVEKTKTSKAELVAAVKEACTYCDRAYDSMTDASAVQVVKLMGRDMQSWGSLTSTVCTAWNTTATWSLTCV